MRTKELFKSMYKTPQGGIYSLVCEKSKMIYISYSKDIITSLARLVRDIYSGNIIYKQLKKDASKLEFYRLENINNCDTFIDVQLKLDYFIQEYKQQGYSLYNSKYKLQQFKIKIEISDDMKLIYVKLVSKGNKKIICGVFDKIWDAEEFATVFETMDIVKPTYAINNLTKIFLSTIKSHI